MWMHGFTEALLFRDFSGRPSTTRFRFALKDKYDFCIFDKSTILSLAGKNIEANFIFLARLFVSLPAQSKRNS
jgi:hypothetical protein